MVMTATRRSQPIQKRNRHHLDYVSLGVLFLATVLITLVLVGVATAGTSPLAIIPPVLLGFWSILKLKN